MDEKTRRVYGRHILVHVRAAVHALKKSSQRDVASKTTEVKAHCKSENRSLEELP